MDVSYRSIVKLLARGMPIGGQDYSDIIEGYIKSIEAMLPEQQSTLKSAYIFSRKAPEVFTIGPLELKEIEYLEKRG